MNGENNTVNPVVPNTSASVTPVTPVNTVNPVTPNTVSPVTPNTVSPVTPNTVSPVTSAQPATVSPETKPIQEVTSNTIVMPPVNFNLNTVNPTIAAEVKKEEVSNTISMAPVDVSTNTDVSTTKVDSNPMVNPNGQIQSINNNNNNDDSFVQEKLKKVEVEYNPPSKFKTFVLILFFILLIGFVIFLPDISNQIRLYKENKNKPPIEEIVDGKLVCTLNTNTANLDKNYSRTFNYKDNKLTGATFETETRGDATEDESVLNELNKKCTIIKESIAGLNGISVSCTYKDGNLVEREKFDYSSYDKEKVSAAYAEAEVDMLEFDLGQDIDSIKTNMLQGGFSCTKEK